MSKKSGAQISCCVFDIETTNLSADFGVVLCGVIKGSHEDPVVFRADRLNPNWGSCRSDDSAVVAAIVNKLLEYDIWVSHNGARFDVPFLRTRMLRWGMEPLESRKLIDPLMLARNKLRMSFNSLEKLASHLGCNSKTDVRPDMWLRASLDGCKKAMGYIVEHCVEDVMTLERIVGFLKSYATIYNAYGSGY